MLRKHILAKIEEHRSKETGEVVREPLTMHEELVDDSQE
jgi:hypothetical protein